MGSLHIYLFGKFDVRYEEDAFSGLEGQKAQELFCYLLLHRHQPQVREKLATLLWENCDTARSKAYLRQTLWQLQSPLSEFDSAGCQLLSVDSDWLGINLAADFWLDVDRFEQANDLTQGLHGHELNENQARRLREAVDIYRGELLENWYQDWCLFERVRLQNIYLMMLDKLMSYGQSHQDFEMGIVYGIKALRYDYARERTHRRLMRLRYLAGDRTGALRQYQQCADALDKELGVEPSPQTRMLCQQIRDAEAITTPADARVSKPAPPGLPLSLETLARLDQLQSTLSTVQKQLEEDITAVKAMQNGSR